ncbi:ABC transporter substrate-binding protein [Paenibacillus sp. FSL H8-0548]|uniref:extracellular solute-binding protein n=2 Tax=Paenibacillus sp. FSL H8-0548 TaxID=1920422 RepID=UPI00096D5900|nr:extracellular solute-binding protein [Paenibacillus sp. FSL H8-0548]OMF37972.1 ABC transporter substrate-binding protein [Paenibacillus sp. FSL H8-0548]
MNMQKRKRITILPVIAIMIIVLVLSACSKNESDNKNGEEATNANNASASAEQGPLSKYDPPIEISFVRSTDDTLETNVLGNLTGETLVDNRWTRLYEETLGIKLKYDWVVKGNDQYNQKLNVTLASGELPNVILVDAIQLKQLADSDMIEDLTDYYDKFASQLTKDTLAQEGTAPFDSTIIDGKLMGLPLTDSAIDRSQLLWIRMDWLEQLGLQPPKSMDDVLAISKAFTEGDPDGNGKQDTFGLGLSKELWGGAMALEGFMAGYDAFPNMWIEDATGSIVYGGIQPEIKKTLQILQNMLKAQQIEKEFGIKDSGKVAEQFASGKIGMQYGQQWNSLWPLQASRDNDPNAQWQPFSLVNESGELAKVPHQSNTRLAYAVRKGTSNPEAVIKMYNLHLEKNWGESAENDKYYAPPEAEGVWKLSPVTPAPAIKNLAAYREINEARQSGDTSVLQGEAKSIQAKLDEFASGSKDGFALWGWERIYGPESSYAVIDQYDKNGQFLMDAFTTVPTPTMIERKSTLDKLQNETFINIILGDSIESFDKFVTDWKRLGGDDITQEVNAARIK